VREHDCGKYESREDERDFTGWAGQRAIHR
jgi:hypothetical protein